MIAARLEHFAEAQQIIDPVAEIPSRTLRPRQRRSLQRSSSPTRSTSPRSRRRRSDRSPQLTEAAAIIDRLPAGDAPPDQRHAAGATGSPTNRRSGADIKRPSPTGSALRSALAPHCLRIRTNRGPMVGPVSTPWMFAMRSSRTHPQAPGTWRAVGRVRCIPRRGRTAHPTMPRCSTSGALAHARAGAAQQAHALLDRAQPLVANDPGLLTEILSLRGRLWKDRLHRAHDTATAREAASRARDEYLAAYALQRATYPGINAATLPCCSASAPPRSTSRARSLRAWPRRPRRSRAGITRHWAKRSCLLGDLDRARDSYAAAYAGAPADAGSIASMRRQVRLLARVVPEADRRSSRSSPHRP